MRVISKSRLRRFWQTPGREDSEGPLRAWHAHVANKTVAWAGWSGLKADFVSASHVGNGVVFNIGGNKYRLVARVFYASHRVFVLKIMTHREYDDGKWREECGCHQPPPSQ
ncbi:mRNA interferase HigB [Pirellulimonas nuda]|uniref:mRNA interferase HigB n=1 Tax=Pirellulimonas nuda TaxID=2528009 RepID=A0A518D6J5_9BACT|nr:mRNA interferase HigB [Pirellulimonas nuda]